MASCLLMTAQTSALAFIALELQSYATYAVVSLGSLAAYRQASATSYLLVGVLATASFVLG
jgi:NADH:ubiquinone oxidoreductase subunit 2 (subunit N)